MTRTIKDVGKRAFGPVDRRPIYDWAEEHVKLCSNYTITGRFRLRHSYYLREPFDAIKAPSVRTICLRAPVRCGKSMLADVTLMYLIVNDPGPCMWNLNTDAMARDHSKMKVLPNIQLCAPVKALLPTYRHDKNVQEIHFSNGMPLFVQGPSEGNLQGKGVRWLINDDIWQWRAGRLYQALYRTRDFDKLGMSKTINLSQGGQEDDEEDVEWNKGDKRELHVRCVACRKFLKPALEFNKEDGTGFQFDSSDAMKDEHGDWHVEEAAKTIRFVCPHCNHTHEDTNATRQAWDLSGRYIPAGRTLEEAESGDFPFVGERVSYHFESSVARPWRGIIEEYLYALNAARRGVLDQLVAWVQKERALPWSESLLYSSTPIKTVDFEQEWPEEEVRFFTLDCQAEGVYWGMICAWSRRGEARRIWFGRVTSEAEILAIQEKYKVKPAHVGIDVSYETKRTYAQCVRNGWLGFRGDSAIEFSIREKRPDGKFFTYRRSWEHYLGDPEIGTVYSGRRMALVVRWSNPTLKDRLARLIAQGRWIVPKHTSNEELELEYRRQMSAEYKKQKRNTVTGRVEMIWVCPSGNNHLHDCACEQVCFATVKKLLPDIEHEPSSG